MRLRKRTARTDLDEDIRLAGRFRLVQRQKTDCNEERRIGCNTQKDIAIRRASKKNFTRFSSLEGPENFSQSSHGFSKVKDLAEWYEKHEEQQDKQWVKRTDEIRLSQLNALQNHIGKISTKTIASHKRNHTQPIISLQSSRKKKSAAHIRESMQSVQYEKCCGLVDDVFKKISILREIGYAQCKINDWMLHFCESRRPFLRDIFMKNVSKSLYTLKEEYEYQKESSLVKEKIKYKVQKSKEQYSFIEIDELNQFNRYLQEILIQKNSLKAREVQESIVQKLSPELIPRVKNQFFIFTKKEPTEVYNFINELIPYEEKYGNFISFSKINKLRFLELNKVERNLKNVYQELLQGEIRKLVKHNTERIKTQP